MFPVLCPIFVTKQLCDNWVLLYISVYNKIYQTLPLGIDQFAEAIFFKSGKYFI